MSMLCIHCTGFVVSNLVPFSSVCINSSSVSMYQSMYVSKCVSKHVSMYHSNVCVLCMTELVCSCMS